MNIQSLVLDAVDFQVGACVDDLVFYLSDCIDLKQLVIDRIDEPISHHLSLVDVG